MLGRRIDFEDVPKFDPVDESVPEDKQPPEASDDEHRHGHVPPVTDCLADRHGHTQQNVESDQIDEDAQAESQDEQITSDTPQIQPVDSRKEHDTPPRSGFLLSLHQCGFLIPRAFGFPPTRLV